jgi:hypothetical protein
MTHLLGLTPATDVAGINRSPSTLPLSEGGEFQESVYHIMHTTLKERWA